MEEQKECDMIANKNDHFQHIKIQLSPQKEEFAKQCQLMNLARLRINEELDQQKADARQINQKLMRFSYLDKQIEWMMEEIKNLERWGLGKEDSSLPVKSVPRTTGFLQLPGKDARTHIRPDRKRNQKALINKDRIDVNYLQLVQEELLSSKKSDGMTLCGTQELSDLINIMTQRIQHGNKKREDEIQIYHEIRNLKETKELYSTPEPSTRNHWYSRQRSSTQEINHRRFIQHKIKFRLDDIEKIKGDLSGREARVRRLKAELEHVRKKIKSLNKELEDVNSKRLEAYKRAYE